MTRVFILQEAKQEKNTLQWRHNEHDGVSDHPRLDCLLSGLLRRRSKKTSKLPVTGLCEGNSTVTGEFPAERASNAEMFPFDDVILENVKGREWHNQMILEWWWVIPLKSVNV